MCQHNPPASMGTPNGDTPLPDGNMLISEINGSWLRIPDGVDLLLPNGSTPTHPTTG